MLNSHSRRRAKRGGAFLTSPKKTTFTFSSAYPVGYPAGYPAGYLARYRARYPVGYLAGYPDIQRAAELRTRHRA